MTEHILILGNSAAAIAAVNEHPRERRRPGHHHGLRRGLHRVLAGADHALLSGEIPESELYFCDVGYYRERDITCHFGTARSTRRRRAA